MLLRTSLSNTKKFFQYTIKNIKSFLSDGYQRLPKTPPFNPFSCSRDVDMKFSQSYNELDQFYTDFTNYWDSTKHKPNKRSKKKLLSHVSNHEKQVLYTQNFSKQFAKARPVMKNYEEERRDDQKKKKLIVYEGRREELWCSKGVEEKRGCLVAQKLKELEMMDKGNVEHVLDIEEALHYYSRLTCPSYLGVVDKFFMDMYAELFSVPAASTSNNMSRPMLRPAVKW